MLKGLLTISVTVALAAGIVHSTQSASSEKAKPNYLFVQTAAAAHLDDDRLTLSGLGPVTVYFSERPERKVGYLTYAEFIDTWKRAADSFASNPPNASLTFRSSGKQQVVVVELTNASLADNELRYRVRLLKGTLPKRFGPTSMFIDGGGLMQLVAYGAQN